METDKVMTEYTLGLIFDKEMESVLLIRKNRGPEQNIGKWNGLGGKIEQGELVLHSLSREIKEECGLVINPSDWKKVVSIYEIYRWKMWVEYTKVDRTTLFEARTLEDEIVQVFKVDGGFLLDSGNQLAENIAWMVALCIDMERKNFQANFRRA